MNTFAYTILELSQSEWFRPALFVSLGLMGVVAIRRFLRKARRSAASFVAALALLGISPTMMTAGVTETISQTVFAGSAEVTPVGNGFFSLPSEWSTVTEDGEEFLCSPDLAGASLSGFVCNYKILDEVTSVVKTRGGLTETFTVTEGQIVHYSCEGVSEGVWKCPTSQRFFKHEGVTS